MARYTTAIVIVPEPMNRGEGSMNAYFTVLFVNIALVGLVAASLYWTHSLWSLLGLVFMMSASAAKIDAACPNCGTKFTATGKE